MKKHKQACVDCHFFVKEYRDDHGNRYTMEVTSEERSLSRARDYSWHKDHFAIACDFSVWSEGHQFDKSYRHELIVEIDRRDFCFFWKYRLGMLLPAARTLQQRESQAREAAQDRRLAIIGLWIAAIALLADVYLKVAEQAHWWPFS